MAAGFVSHNITTATGVTFGVVSWVPDTSSPDVGNVPVHLLRDSGGNEVVTAAQVTSLLGYVDGLEALIGSTNTKLDTIHADLGTTLAGYVDGLETLSTSTNTKLDQLHTDLVAATPAGTNLIGRVASSLETSTVYNATTALTPKFAKISASSSGANTVVSGVASKKIRVLAWEAVANAAVNFKWQSATTPTDLTGLYYMAGQGNGVARSFNPVGYFETVAGEALSLNLSGAVAVGGSLVYVEV